MTADILQRMKNRIFDLHAPKNDDSRGIENIFPPLTEIQLINAERELGFEIPTLLRRLYLEIGNGGYGPGYGMLGLVNGTKDECKKDAVEHYQEFRSKTEDPRWYWPEKLLPIFMLGCGMYACVDCATVDGKIVWFEPNPHNEGEPWDDCFIPLADSIAEYLAAWLDDKDLFEPAWNRKFPNEDL